MAFTSEELEMFRDEISRFASETIVPTTTPYERPIPAPTLIGLLGQIEAMGVLPQACDDPIGIWADTRDSSATVLSLDALRALGKANAGLALAVHRQALSRWLMRQTGLRAPDDSAALAVTGHYGLARGALAAWLRNANTLSSEDSTLLADWLNRCDHHTVICALPQARQILWPIWHDGVIQWQIAAVERLDSSTQVAHGLDELKCSTVRSRTATTELETTLSSERSRELYSSTLKMEFLGLTAIGLGVLERSSERASEFSAIRSQGGKRIEQHPAVQIMLAQISSIIRQVEHSLRGFQRALDAIALADAASLRFTASDPLVHGCHQVIQIHGGIGYMRDAGPEKYLRDQNMLRLCSGGVSGLALFIHGVTP